MAFFVKTVMGKQTFDTADDALAEVCEKQTSGAVAEVYTDAGKRLSISELINLADAESLKRNVEGREGAQRS